MQDSSHQWSWLGDEWLKEAWEELGFEKWSHGNIAGLYRKVTFRKEAFWLEVASYQSEDYIIWDYSDISEVEKLIDSLEPRSDLMARRFLILSPCGWEKQKRKSFKFGWSGWMEWLCWNPDVKVMKKFSDLSFLVQKAIELKSKRSTYLY